MIATIVSPCSSLALRHGPFSVRYNSIDSTHTWEWTSPFFCSRWLSWWPLWWMCPKSSRTLQKDMLDDKTISVSSLTGTVDKEALNSFFRELIERRYYAGKAAYGTDVKKQSLVHCHPSKPQMSDGLPDRIDIQNFYSMVWDVHPEALDHSMVSNNLDSGWKQSPSLPSTARMVLEPSDFLLAGRCSTDEVLWSTSWNAWLFHIQYMLVWLYGIKIHKFNIQIASLICSLPQW